MCLNGALNQIEVNFITLINFNWISNQNVPEHNAKSNLDLSFKLPIFKKDLIYDIITNKTDDNNLQIAPLANCIIIPFLISSFSVQNCV